MSGIDSMNEFYVQENMQLLEQLEEILLGGQSDSGELEQKEIEEIFRAMHTIKGASAMMGYENLTHLTHSIEDIFDAVRNGLKLSSDMWEELIDLVLTSIDFLKEEIMKVQNGSTPDGDIDELRGIAKDVLKRAKGEETSEKKEEVVSENSQEEAYLYSKVFFQEGCAMESIRALGVVTNLNKVSTIAKITPEDLDSDCDEEIVKNGLEIYLYTPEGLNAVEEVIKKTMFLKNYEIRKVDNKELDEVFGISSEEVIIEPVKEEQKEEIKETKPKVTEIKDTIKEEVIKQSPKKEVKQEASKNTFLTVNINKIDTLMNLVGEIVTTESMVEKQSQLENFDRDNFEKQARRLHQLTNELQDVVMSIRMVPISSTFTKMQRVVRDMSRKTGKSVELVLIGEQTEVDKNILENISDPLMHMIRNSMDHGIETPEERANTTKPSKATIILEAKNTGGDVVIIIKDDGRGINKEAVIKKAIEKGITTKNPDEISDKEAYNFILAPGFSTKEQVSEYSGRGVGMDVVYTNIRKLRGSISIDSEFGKGSMFILRIPLTLAIVDGMKVQIGKETYIIPALNIKEVFTQGGFEVVKNPNGEEHSIIRGECYKVTRLSEILGIEAENKDDDIMILVETEIGSVCILVDKIIGQQHVVIKPIPPMLTQFEQVQSHMSGCSILEDGSISLILDANAIINM